MLRHHFLLTYRNFLRNKTTFFINLIGLSTGLACTFLIYLWVNDEMSMDKFHENEDHLYQIGSNYEYTERTHTNFETDGPLADALINEIPEIKYSTTATPIEWFERFTLSANNNDLKAFGKYAGIDFFNVFTYPFVIGDKNKALLDEHSIAISEQLAIKLFNTKENVLGKVIEFQHDQEYTVTGVFKNVPDQSTEKFDFVLPFKVFQNQYPKFTQWDQRGPSTFLVLSEDANIEQLNRKINESYQTRSDAKNIHLFLTKYSDKYLFGKYENGVQSGGRIAYVRLFSLIALFVLIIACINFMNLSTARASQRMKEIGIKKSIGANRNSLVWQFLGESLTLTGIASVVALILILVALPYFNDITGKNLIIQSSNTILLAFPGIVIITGLISGSYPALLLSGYKPVSILKGKLNTSTGVIWARKGLVIFQFSLSAILIVAVLVVYKQVDFIQSKNIGFDKDNVLCFDLEGKAAQHKNAFMQELKRLPGVINASSSNSRMVGSYGATSGIKWEGKDPDEILSFEIIQVDYDLLETLGIEMAAGRSFTRADIPDRSRVIFNEAAIKAMGLKDPIGKIIKFWGNDVEIIGVTKNFHIESFHEEIKPMIIDLLPDHTDYVMVRIQNGRERETISGLQEFYESYNPGFVFDFKFINDNYQALYNSEKLIGKLSKIFAGLAILISCLGLFGLAVFTVEQSLKEISIRKVLGSSELGIVKLLTSEFTIMVSIALLIGIPVSFFATEHWLESYAYRVELEWWYFVGAGVITILITWITVGLQTIKAAMVNPAKILRSE
ncbi:MAG: ABC transporter permease [Bacteroidota bacterium]